MSINPAYARAAQRILELKMRIYEHETEYMPIALSTCPHLEIGKYERFTKAIEMLGFKSMGDFENRNISRDPSHVLSTTVLRFHSSSDHRVTCNYYQCKRSASSWIRLFFIYVLGMKFKQLYQLISSSLRTSEMIDFCTEFSDGSHLTTSNAILAASISRPSNMECNFFPEGTGYRQLHEAHRSRMQAILDSHSGLRVQEIRSPEDLFASSERARLLKKEHAREIGYVTREELIHLARGKTEVAEAVFTEIQRLLAAKSNGDGVSDSCGPGPSSSGSPF